MGQLESCLGYFVCCPCAAIRPFRIFSFRKGKLNRTTEWRHKCSYDMDKYWSKIFFKWKKPNSLEYNFLGSQHHSMRSWGPRSWQPNRPETTYETTSSSKKSLIRREKIWQNWTFHCYTHYVVLNLTKLSLRLLPVHDFAFPCAYQNIRTLKGQKLFHRNSLLA